MLLPNRLCLSDVSAINVRHASCAGIMLCCVLLSGCASMMKSPTTWFEKEPEFVTPNKVIPVWSDTVLHQAGQAGLRGCGGRVMFYSGDGKRASRVDGTLIVYAWDDSKASPDRQPDKKFVFPADDLQQHYSASTIGDSYSFWLPWDQAGGERKELTLVARFIGRNGSEITSSPAKVILPGNVPLPSNQSGNHSLAARTSDRAKTKSQPAAQTGTIQQTAFEVATESDGVGLRNDPLKTSEIPLTEGFLNRNMQNHRPQVYTSDDLFQETGNSGRQSDPRAGNRSETVPSREQSSANVSRSTGSTSGSGVQQQATEPNSAPAGRSLRFQDRVRTSREAQQSVGRALSEQYQSGSRTAPWQKD